MGDTYEEMYLLIHVLPLGRVLILRRYRLR